jgi:hypothetical protein
MLSAIQLVDCNRADVIDQAIASLLGLDPVTQTQMLTP